MSQSQSLPPRNLPRPLFTPSGPCVAPPPRLPPPTPTALHRLPRPRTPIEPLGKSGSSTITVKLVQRMFIQERRRDQQQPHRREGTRPTNSPACTMLASQGDQADVPGSQSATQSVQKIPKKVSSTVVSRGSTESARTWTLELTPCSNGRRPSCRPCRRSLALGSISLQPTVSAISNIAGIAGSRRSVKRRRTAPPLESLPVPAPRNDHNGYPLWEHR